MMEKAKKAADNIQEGLVQFEIHPKNYHPPHAQPQHVENKNFEYDETYFSFKLEGGPKHTEPLTAVARIEKGKPGFPSTNKEGDKAGKEVPLICKWFKSDASDEMKEVEGLTGTVYQPTVDDVGARYE